MGTGFKSKLLLSLHLNILKALKFVKCTKILVVGSTQPLKVWETMNEERRR